MLLIKKADELLACLKPYEGLTYRRGPEPDFVALHKRINRNAMPTKPTIPLEPSALVDNMVLLIKEELHFLAGAGDDAAPRYPRYVKITASNVCRGLRRGTLPRTGDAHR